MVNTPIIPKQRYNESEKNQSQSISIQIFLILKWSPTMTQNINKLKLNKEEFKNLFTRKIIIVHEFFGNKIELRSQIRPSKTTNC